MSLVIDPPTMFLALLASTAAAALVLLWSFSLNRSESSLLWIAVGFLISGMATVVLAQRGALPDWFVIPIGGATQLFGVTFAWTAARVFNRRPVIFWVPVAGPLAWLAICSVPAIFSNYDARAVLLSAITAAYILAAAREFVAVRDGLLTRVPMTFVLAIHGVAVLLRIPFILTDDEAGFSFLLPWFGLATLETLVFIQVLAFLMVSLAKERVEKRLRDAAHTDPLTGLGNRRAFFQRAEAAVAQAARTSAPLSIVVFDLDRFKAINDRHGHPVGDAVIKAFAAVALGRLRASDFVARFGGEEFAVLLPDTDGAHAVLVAIQICQEFQSSVAELPHDGLSGTVSGGVAGLSTAAPTLETILSSADRALYNAKRAGGGQVRLAEPEAGEPAESAPKAA